MKEEQDQGPPGYGTLIKIAREAKGLSPESAAAQMPFKYSGSSWRQVEVGYRGAGAKRVKVTGRAATVAAMARTVGITADRLQEHHQEAAAILREMERQDTLHTPEPASDITALLESVPPHVRRMIDAALTDVDPQDRPALLREMAADYETLTKSRTRGAGKQQPRRTG